MKVTTGNLNANRNLIAREKLMLEEIKKLKADKEELKEQLRLHGVGITLPNKEVTQSKIIELTDWVEKEINPDLSRVDFRAGFVYCYEWIGGNLKKLGN